MNTYRDLLYASYRTSSYGLLNSGKIDSHRESYRQEFCSLIPPDKKAKILDLGCGSGFLVRFLLQEGYENVLGVDNSAEQVEFAKSHNLPVIQADALEYLTHNTNFDTIFLTDAIEHLIKDEIVTLLLRMREALAPNGYVIIRTPNACSFMAANSRYMDFTHEISFTEKSLRQVLLACNFKRISIAEQKAPFGWKPKRLMRWMLLKIWRMLWSTIYTLEVGSNRPKLFGKNLIAIAYK